MRILIAGTSEENRIWAEKIARSPLASAVLCWNTQGTEDEELRAEKAKHSTLQNTSFLAHCANKNNIDLLISTNEQLLRSGIANALQVFRIKCFGPTRTALALAEDREFYESFFARYAIPYSSDLHLTPFQVPSPSDSPLKPQNTLSYVIFIGPRGVVDIGYSAASSFLDLGNPSKIKDLTSQAQKLVVGDLGSAIISEGIQFSGCLNVQVSFENTKNAPLISGLSCSLKMNELEHLSKAEGRDWLEDISRLFQDRRSTRSGRATLAA